MKILRVESAHGNGPYSSLSGSGRLLSACPHSIPVVSGKQYWLIENAIEFYSAFLTYKQVLNWFSEIDWDILAEKEAQLIIYEVDSKHILFCDDGMQILFKIKHAKKIECSTITNDFVKYIKKNARGLTKLLNNIH